MLNVFVFTFKKSFSSLLQRRARSSHVSAWYRSKKGNYPFNLHYRTGEGFLQKVWETLKIPRLKVLTFAVIFGNPFLFNDFINFLDQVMHMFATFNWILYEFEWVSNRYLVTRIQFVFLFWQKIFIRLHHFM